MLLLGLRIFPFYFLQIRIDFRLFVLIKQQSINGRRGCWRIFCLRADQYFDNDNDDDWLVFGKRMVIVD